MNAVLCWPNVVVMTQTLEKTLETKTATPRLNIYKVSPGLYDAMMSLEHRGRQGCRPDHRRADQDPGIADQPLRVLPRHAHRRCPQAGRDRAAKLALIAAWKEAGDLFTEREQAALELTEAMHRTAPRPRPRRRVRACRSGDSPSGNWDR